MGLNMRKVKKLTLYLFLIFMIFSTGCQKKDNLNLRRLNINFNMDPKTLDPRKSGDLVSSAVLFLLSSGLTEATASGEIVPALAESYEISNDKKTYTFHIRKDAKWSDGTKITATDFEKSWKKAIDPNFPALCPQLFYPIKNVERAIKGDVPFSEVGINALDDKTLVVHLNSPTPYFLSLTSFCIYFPVPSHIVDKNPHWDSGKEPLICSGPFKLKKWNPTSDMTVEKNPHHWNAKNIWLNEIAINFVGDENTSLQMYENGQIDWVGALLSPLPIDSIASLKKSKEFSESAVGGTTFCTFNVEKFPFNNKNMRKAFGLAINRKAIIDNIIQGNEIIATRCIPPLLMTNKEISFLKDNDIEKAKEHLNLALNELGIKKEDLKITFTYGSNISHKKQAETLVENWKKLFGIPITLEQYEEKVLLDKLHKHQYQSALSHWIIQYRDPMNIFDRFKKKIHSKNYPQWENETYINLLNYSATCTDSSLREQVLEKAEELFLEEMPLSPIYHHNYKMLTKPHVKGLFIGPVGEVRFDKIYLKK
jgi:oligopeptide transport system substrate-binding protein